MCMMNRYFRAHSNEVSPVSLKHEARKSGGEDVVHVLGTLVHACSFDQVDIGVVVWVDDDVYYYIC